MTQSNITSGDMVRNLRASGALPRKIGCLGALLEIADGPPQEAARAHQP